MQCYELNWTRFRFWDIGHQNFAVSWAFYKDFKISTVSQEQLFLFKSTLRAQKLTDIKKFIGAYYSCLRGSYYSGRRTNRGGRTNRGSTVFVSSQGKNRFIEKRVKKCEKLYQDWKIQSFSDYGKVFKAKHWFHKYFLNAEII